MSVKANTAVTIDQSIDQSIPYKEIGHGTWKFQYKNNKNIFNTDPNDYDKGLFSSNVVKNWDTDQTESPHHLSEKDLDDFRRAALIHKVARKKALSLLKAGNTLGHLVDEVEEIIIKLTRQNKDEYFLKGSPSNNMAGIAFPVGVNINNVVAHDSKTVGIPDERMFYEGDVVKVDIGVHVNGRIIDSAFTHIISGKAGIHDDKNIYNSVLEASRESMFEAIKLSGPDQPLDEISEMIDEVIQSYEVQIGSSTLPIKPIQGIGGHNIKQYLVHGGKLILSTPDYKLQEGQRMEDGEIYAIETYASTGNGIMTQNDELYKCTHWMETEKELTDDKPNLKKPKKFFGKTPLYAWLKTRNGLPFSSSWIHGKIPKLEKAYKTGHQHGLLMGYPPLYDEQNSVVAQFEHTVRIGESATEIFSLGEDY